MDEATVRLPRGRSPHRLVDPSTGQQVTALPWDEPSERDVIGQPMDRPGGVFWVDVVGWGNRLPDDADWWEQLAVFCRRIADETYTPLVFPRPFVPFTEAHGPGPHRMSMDEWAQVTGFVGAQHLPGWQAGEPGDLTRLVTTVGVVADGIEGSPSFEIHHALHQAGVYSGNVSEPVSAMTVDSLQRLLELHSGHSTLTEELQDQIATLVELNRGLRADIDLLRRFEREVTESVKRATGFEAPRIGDVGAG